jgi:hypothetical protein
VWGRTFPGRTTTWSGASVVSGNAWRATGTITSKGTAYKYTPTVARDKVVFPLREIQGNIWLTQMP